MGKKDLRAGFQDSSFCSTSLWGFKPALQLLEFSLNDNHSSFQLPSSSLVRHCHVSASVQIKKLCWCLVIPWDCSLSVGFFEQTSPFHLSAANKQLLPVKQAHKLGRCNSYLQNLKLSITHWLTHSLTGIGGRRCYLKISSKRKRGPTKPECSEPLFHVESGLLCRGSSSPHRHPQILLVEPKHLDSVCCSHLLSLTGTPPHKYCLPWFLVPDVSKRNINWRNLKNCFSNTSALASEDLHRYQWVPSNTSVLVLELMREQTKEMMLELPTSLFTWGPYNSKQFNRRFCSSASCRRRIAPRWV